MGKEGQPGALTYMKTSRTAWIVSVILLLTGSTGCLVTASDSPAAAETPAVFAPLPLDPLGDSEIATAHEIAIRAAAERGLLEGRYRFIGAALHSDKVDALRPLPSRLADVQIYRYESNDVLRIVADVGTEPRVVSLLIEKFQPRLTAEELEDALAIALADPAVAMRIPQTSEDLRVGAILTSGSDRLCPFDRCVEIYIEVGGASPLLVVVDLSREVVLTVNTLEAEMERD